jgi:hypothetical protein
MRKKAPRIIADSTLGLGYNDVIKDPTKKSTRGGMMRCLRAPLCKIFYALLLTCRTNSAQVATVRLEGVLQDPSGAVVTGATVSVVNTSTQAQAETSVTAEGRFIFLSLLPGLYTLSVEAAGFPKIVVPSLELNVGATVTQNVKLEVGDIAENVVVRAPAERVQVADAQIAHAVTLRDIEILPQLGRGPMTLALFTSGIQISG